MSAVSQANEDFQREAIAANDRYSQACANLRWSQANVVIGDIDEALSNTGSEFDNAIVKAVKSKDETEIGRLVLAALEKHLWACACERAGFEDEV